MIKSMGMSIHMDIVREVHNWNESVAISKIKVLPVRDSRAISDEGKLGSRLYHALHTRTPLCVHLAPLIDFRSSAPERPTPKHALTHTQPQ
jgi:hypothetical protein